MGKKDDMRGHAGFEIIMVPTEGRFVVLCTANTGKAGPLTGD
jgi:hypothetical protein